MGAVAVATGRQWRACALDNARVDPADDVVTLSWSVVEPGVGSGVGVPVVPAGLAVDRACFVYHGVPAEGRVERVRWLGPSTGSAASAAADVLVPWSPPLLGSFAPVGPAGGGVQAVALAVDDEGRLFVVDGADGAVAVYDLADRRLLQRSVLSGRALDVASVGSAVLVLCDDPVQPVWRLAARRSPVPMAWVSAGRVLRRLAAGTSGVWGLSAAGEVVALDRPSLVLGVVADATDLEVAGDGSVVVADASGAAFTSLSVEDVDDRVQRPLVARDYDGRGIVRMPDGSIGFWSRAGRLRRAVAAMLRFEPSGSVTAGPLDARTYHESWGRLLVDACVPEGTSVWVSAAVGDDETEAPELGPVRRMHCRETGSEVPWATVAAGDPYETLEAPVGSGQGRYLWLRLELRGTTRSSPKVRAVRAEHPGHDLVRRLPRTYSRDPAAASFLYRYLAVAGGLLGDISRRADERDVLLDPWAVPSSALPWLGSLVGMALDDRWSESARRTLVAEAACLFRKRGTKAGLERLLSIYLGEGRPARIVELFQVRGQGQGAVGSAVGGGGLRVGGAAAVAWSEAGSSVSADAFARTAHRFSVVVPAVLDDGQERAVRDLLEEHKPAHTAYELCTVGAGMRVGRGLYVELTSMVGPGSGFEQVRVGDSALGRDGVLGRVGVGAHGGVRPGTARVGRTTRVGS
jgi:phage tail-like protein